MKLLLDQNISARLLVRLEPAFPGSTQARRAGLERANDSDLWYFARTHDFAIVSKDSDFYERSLRVSSAGDLAEMRQRLDTAA
ncbi:MAG: DUF5615 family PIN-like protein [Thermoanaerobaculia bacterium]